MFQLLVLKASRGECRCGELKDLDRLQSGWSTVKRLEEREARLEM